MNKTLIALAVGAAFVAPAAYADVTLSGSINAGPAVVKSNNGSSGVANSIRSTVGAAQGTLTGQTNVGLNTNYSNITIASMEDLGGGLKLDFAYQLTANFQTTSNSASNRNSHIGLVGDTWGGVWYGTNENLYERYFYTVDPLDGAAGMGGNLQILGSPGYGSVFDNPGANGGAGPRFTADFYRRTDQTVWYDSPSWGGFTFGAYGTLAAYKTRTNLPNPQIWGVGGKYVGPSVPIQAWVAYESHKDLDGLAVITGTAAAQVANFNAQGGGGGSSTGNFPNATANVGQSTLPSSTKDQALQVGGGFTFGDLFVFANFEYLKYKADGLAAATDIIQYRRTAYSVGAKWNVASGYIGGQWIQAFNGNCQSVATACDASETGAMMVGLGYYHTLSKQTQAYIMGTWIGNDDLNQYNTAGGVGATPALGGSILGLTVGLKHSF
jgi:predicted porin